MHAETWCDFLHQVLALEDIPKSSFIVEYAGAPPAAACTGHAGCSVSAVQNVLAAFILMLGAGFWLASAAHAVPCMLASLWLQPLAPAFDPICPAGFFVQFYFAIDSRGVPDQRRGDGAGGEGHRPQGGALLPVGPHLHCRAQAEGES